MATYYARKSGNINATDIWATDPKGIATAVTFDPSDILVSNSFTITVNVSVNVSQVTNTTIGGAVTGGSFALQNGVTLTANVVGGNSVCVSFSVAGSSSSATIIGNITNGTNFLGSSTGVLSQTSPGTLTIIGDITGGVGGGNNNYLVTVSAGTLNIIGNCSLVTASAAYFFTIANLGVSAIINITGNINSFGSSTGGCVWVAAGVINITGNITGGSNAIGAMQAGNTTATLSVVGTVTAGNGGAGVSMLTNATGTISINGTLQASTNSAAVTGTTGFIYLTGPFLCASNGRVANAATVWRWNSSLNPNTYIQIPTSNLSANRNFVTPENVTGMPSANNVRLGVSYAGNTLTGTCAVPPSGAVAFGVPVDNTTGTALLTPADFWNYNTSLITASGSIGERLKNCATIASVGQQLSDALS